MAIATVNATRASTEVNKVWRKMQSTVFPGLRFSCEELDWFGDIGDLGLDWSARETLLMLDVNEGGRVGRIPEGGYKARPGSPNLEEGTIDLMHYDVRFTMTELAKWADAGKKNQLEQQLKFQSRKAVESLGRHLADYIHGSSTGVLATTDTDIAGTTVTITLTAGYGQSTITDTTYIANLFRTSTDDDLADWIGLVDGSTLVHADSVGYVTNITASTGAATVVLKGAVTTTTNGLKVVKANTLDDTVTDYNGGLVGFIDGIFGTTVHNISSSTVPNFSAAYTESSTGRLTGVKVRKAFQRIENDAPEAYGKPNFFAISQGVELDMIAYERPALRFSDAFALEIDGDVKARGMKPKSPKRMPPGYAYLGNTKALGKIMLTPMPDEAGVGANDLQPYQDRSLAVADLPVVLGLVWKARKAWAGFTGCTTQ